MNWLRMVARRAAGPILARFAPPLMKVASYGDEHPDKTFLVIRRTEPQVGLCSLLLSNLAWFRYAETNGLIPVVDMQTTRNLYLSRAERGRFNAWEAFAAQPAGYSLADIASAAHVVIANGIMPVRGFMPGFGDDCSKWRPVVRKMLRFDEKALDACRNEPFEAALAGERVVGVLARGTDYVRLKPHGHPVQPSASQLIGLIREREPSARVYLVTEDASMERAFREAFGDRLVLSNQTTVAYAGGYLADCRGVWGSRERGFRYLRAIIDLSRCPSVIAGRTSGSLIAAVMAAPEQTRHYCDLGLYP
ncbi:MAG: hypothetical protein ACI4RD_09870 [Kiritimatiellia bacterium]